MFKNKVSISLTDITDIATITDFTLITDTEPNKDITETNTDISETNTGTKPNKYITEPNKDLPYAPNNDQNVTDLTISSPETPEQFTETPEQCTETPEQFTETPEQFTETPEQFTEQQMMLGLFTDHNTVNLTDPSVEITLSWSIVDISRTSTPLPDEELECSITEELGLTEMICDAYAWTGVPVPSDSEGLRSEGDSSSTEQDDSIWDSFTERSFTESDMFIKSIVIIDNMDTNPVQSLAAEPVITEFEITEPVITEPVITDSEPPQNEPITDPEPPQNKPITDSVTLVPQVNLYRSAASKSSLRRRSIDADLDKLTDSLISSKER